MALGLHPQSIILLLRSKKSDFQSIKMFILKKNIEIEKEVTWNNGGLSIYFRDPGGI